MYLRSGIASELNLVLTRVVVAILPLLVAVIMVQGYFIEEIVNTGLEKALVECY